MVLKAGEDPATGEAIYLLFGQYGPYVQRGQASEETQTQAGVLPRGTKPEDVTLEMAGGLLQRRGCLVSTPKAARCKRVWAVFMAPMGARQGQRREGLPLPQG